MSHLALVWSTGGFTKFDVRTFKQLYEGQTDAQIIALALQYKTTQVVYVTQDNPH
jgi:hypothetical protein